MPVLAQVIAKPELCRHLPIVFFLAASASFTMAFLVRKASLRLKILDRPGERSSHTVPVPRTGGIAILTGTLAGMLVMSTLNLAFIVAAGVGLLMAAISLVDDIVTIPSLPRLAVHLLVAGLTIGLVGLGLRDFGLPYVHLAMPAWLGVSLAVLFTVGFVNFFNFMDGINGIAAAQGIWGGLTISILLLWGGTNNSVLSAAAVAGGCLGFLPHNFPRARMFMGDVGSTVLGFVLAMLTLVGAKFTPFPWIAFVLPLGVFVYDATFTLVKRIIQGQNFLKAHRQHHYQLLVRSGWSHARVTSLQMLLMTLCSAAALVYAFADDAVRLAVLGIVLAVFVTYSILVHRYFAVHRGDSLTVQSSEPDSRQDGSMA